MLLLYFENEYECKNKIYSSKALSIVSFLTNCRQRALLSVFQHAQTAAPPAQGHPAAVPLRQGHREGRDPPLQRRSRARAEGGARRAQSHAPLRLLPTHRGRGGLPQYSGLHRGPNIQIFR